LSLRIAGSQLPSEPVQRIEQRQQIGGAKSGSARRDPAELIHRVYIGERACDRAKPPVVTYENQPVFAPMAASADYLEGAAIQRVKRMGDPHLEIGRANMACS
jgi:hypothetical protein